MANKWSKGYDEHIPKHVRQVFKDNPDTGAVIDTVSAFQALKAAMGKFKDAYHNFKTYQTKQRPKTKSDEFFKYSDAYRTKGPFWLDREQHYNKYNRGTKPQNIKHFPAQRIKTKDPVNPNQPTKQRLHTDSDIDTYYGPGSVDREMKRLFRKRK